MTLTGWSHPIFSIRRLRLFTTKLPVIRQWPKVSDFVARCSSQKTYGHARIARDSKTLGHARIARERESHAKRVRFSHRVLTGASCKTSVTQNHIPRATAYQ